MTDIGSTIEDMGIIADRSSSEIERLNETDASASARLALIGRFAKELNPHSRHLEEITSTFAAGLQELDGSINGIIDFVEQNPDMLEKGDAREFLESIAGLAGTARESFGELNTFAAVAEGLGTISKRLREPGRRIGRGLRTMSKAAALWTIGRAGFFQFLPRHQLLVRRSRRTGPIQKTLRQRPGQMCRISRLEGDAPIGLSAEGGRRPPAGRP